ncbi:TPA: hypothetical protein U0371_002941, partial [Listeria monocytogenes]|nr:hypothetical protein [Listeria monocytogenes]
MEFLSQNWFGLLVFIALAMGLYHLTKKEKEKDGITDYSKEDLGGR